MFVRTIAIERIDAAGGAHSCPIAWIDNFAMRNFTNDVIFDDTLPIADGVLEVGNRVPLLQLEAAIGDWFHRKGYLQPAEYVRATELPRS